MKAFNGFEAKKQGGSREILPVGGYVCEIKSAKEEVYNSSNGEFRFLVEDIQLTPFTCMVHLTCLGDTAYIDENADAIFQAVTSARDDFTLHFADGTQHLLGIQLSMGNCEDKYNRDGGSYYDEYQLDTVFAYPIAVKNVTAITMFGEEFPLS